jgi:alkylation response protein AidB-like acyl-CoA dehydrogenase
VELSLSREDAAFRDEVRDFIANNYPQEMRVPNPETDLTEEQMLLWRRILHRKGWIAPLWPKEYGGPGWSITKRFIFEQETSRAGSSRDPGWQAMECPSMIAVRIALMEGVSAREVQYGQLLTLAAALSCGTVIRLLLIFI